MKTYAILSKEPEYTPTTTLYTYSYHHLQFPFTW